MVNMQMNSMKPEPGSPLMDSGYAQQMVTTSAITVPRQVYRMEFAKPDQSSG